MSRNLSEKEIREIADGVAVQYIKDVKEKEAFFESDEYWRIFNIVKQEYYVDEEDLRYNDSLKDKGVTHKQFSKLHNCVSWKFQDDFITEKESPFPRIYHDYNGVRFYLMFGQGCSMWTEKIK